MKIQTTTKEKSADFEKVRIPEEMYKAKLKEVKDISEGEHGQRVAWIYTIQRNPEVDLAMVCYKTVATKNNKIGKTLIAHGVELNDQEFDVESLYGKEVRVLVEDYVATKEGGNAPASTISKVKPLEEKKVN